MNRVCTALLCVVLLPLWARAELDQDTLNKVNEGVIDRFDVDEFLSQYVWDCFYLVGRKNWLKYPDHLCNEMILHPSATNSTGAPVMVSEKQKKIAAAYQKFLDYQREDEQAAVDCFANKFDHHYGPCEGLTWNITQVPSNERERIKIAFFKHLQQTYFDNLYKTKAEKDAEEQATKRNTSVDNSWQAMVHECFEHQNEHQYPACYGIRWGYQPEGMYPTEFQNKLREYLSHLFLADFPKVQIRLYLESKLATTKKPRYRAPSCDTTELAHHCMTYHMWDHSDKRCDGISFGIPLLRRGKADPTRDAYAAHHAVWDYKEKRKKEISLNNDPEMKIVLDCFYFNEWFQNASHPCHRIAYGYGGPFTPAELRMQQQFQDLWLERQIANCFYNHRFDKALKCYDITFAVRPMDHGGPLTPRQEKIKKIWDALKQGKSHFPPPYKC